MFPFYSVLFNYFLPQLLLWSIFLINPGARHGLPKVKILGSDFLLIKTYNQLAVTPFVTSFLV